MTDLWHYAVGSERKGPVTQATLGKLLAAGEISAETYVWQPGMDNWVHLGDAAGLKALVTGVGADRPVEAFVEEDTAFTSQDELLATHSVLAGADESAPIATAVITEVEAVDGDDGISEDTVVESVDEALGAAGVSLASAMGVSVEEDDVAEIVVEAAPVHEDPVGEVDPFAALDALDDLSDNEPKETLAALAASDVTASAGAPAASASGVDIFGDADTDDIFAAAAPAPAPAQTVGKHSRHANSVLFSLDELGRDDTGAATRSAGADDPFLTDSSGLIDIKAIADSQQGEVERADPFGSSGMISSPRPAMGTISVPIVERRSSLGPWILAAVALLLVGGGVIFALFSGGGSTDSAGPAVVASATAPGEAEAAAKEAAAQEAAAQEAAAQEAAEAEAAKEAAAKEAAAKEAAEAEAEAATAAAAEGAPQEGDDGAAAEGAVAGGDEGEAKEGDGEEAPTVAAAPTRRATTPRKPRPAPEPAAAVVEAPRAATVTPPSSGNTRKVNALLEKLNQPSDGGTTTTEDTGGLPAKLSAAALRQTLRQNRDRFSRCGEMVEGASGPVKVSTSFVILGASGEVKSARVVNAGGTSPAVQRCVVEELRKTTFSRFADATMTVNFPIQLL